MEVCNGIWKTILAWNGIWNGRLLAWNGNGMEENCQYGYGKIVFHSIPCPSCSQSFGMVLTHFRLAWYGSESVFPSSEGKNDCDYLMISWPKEIKIGAKIFKNLPKLLHHGFTVKFSK